MAKGKTKKSVPLFIGLTGPFRAGCTDLVGEFLINRLDFKLYSLSKIVKDALIADIGTGSYGKLPTPERRKKLQDTGDKLRYDHQDAAYVAKALINRGKIPQKHRRILIDSIRHSSEAEFLCSALPNFFLLGVDAPKEVRWDRCKEEYNFNEMLFNRDEARDRGEGQPEYGQKVGRCTAIADVIIQNGVQFTPKNQDVRDRFEDRLEGFMQLMQEPGLRRPDPDELYMHQAHSFSLKSPCRRREVGALIVRLSSKEEKVGRSELLAAGWNDVPKGSISCSVRGGRDDPDFCHRQYLQEDVIKKMKFCSFCGKKLKVDSPKVPFYCPRCHARLDKDLSPGKLLDLCMAIHAEEAAILMALKSGIAGLRGTILYTSTSPCMLCAKDIADVGIGKVVYLNPYPDGEALEILAAADVKIEKYEGVGPHGFHRLFSRRYVPQIGEEV